jgi:hypothetical protein
MKKLFTFLILLAWASYAQAGGVMLMGGGTPVAAGGTGTLGQPLHDTSNSAAGTGNGYYGISGMDGTTNTAGTISYCHAYVSTVSTNTTVVLSVHDLGNFSCTASTVPKACCTGAGTGTCTAAQLYSGSTTVASITAAGWINIAVTGSTSLATNTPYWVAIQSDKDLGVIYDYEADGTGSLAEGRLIAEQAFANPAVTISATPSAIGFYNWSFYCNNTAGNPN